MMQEAVCGPIQTLAESLRRWLLVLAVWVVAAPALAGEADSFKSWVSLRDTGVVKQSLDYSCGLAALATLLTHGFGDRVSERQLLDELTALPGFSEAQYDWQRNGVSLAALQALAERRGYGVAGVTASLEALAALRVPALAALEVDGVAHFTVLSAAPDDSGRYHLADPSWGNTSLREQTFADYWLVPGEGRGRLLLVMPQDPGAVKPPGLAAPRVDGLLLDFARQGAGHSDPGWQKK